MSEATKRKKLERVNITGEVTWANLVKPDTKFDADGKYQFTIRITEEQATKLNDYVRPLAQAMMKEEIAKADKPAQKKALAAYTYVDMAKPETDRETGEPTGSWELRASTKAVIRPKGKDPINITVKVYDSAGKVVPTSVKSKIGRGSKATVAVDLSPWALASGKTFGVTPRLYAVQLTEFVPYEGGGGNPFKSVVGGFVAPDGEEGDGEAAPFNTDGGGTDDAGGGGGDF